MNALWKPIALIGAAAMAANIAVLGLVMTAYYSGFFWNVAYASYGWRH